MTESAAGFTSKITPEFQSYFPTEGAVYEYVRWAVETTHAPKTFHLGSILSVLAYDACRRGFTFGGGRPFRFNLALVSGSGSAKSTAKQRALHFMRDWYGRLGLTYPGLMAQGSRAGLLHAMKDRRMPNPNHNVGGFITPIFLHLDELTALLRQRDLTEMVNMLYDGSDYQINERQFQKKKEEAESAGRIIDDSDFVIRQPRLFSIFCTTPIALEMVTSEDQAHGGMFGRYLWLRERIDPDELTPNAHRYPRWRKNLLDGYVQLDDYLKRTYNVHPFPSKDITILDQHKGSKVLDKLRQPVWDAYRLYAKDESPLAGMAIRLHDTIDQVAALFAYAVGTNYADEEMVFRATNFMFHCLQSVTTVLGEVAGSELYRIANKLEALVKMAGPEGLLRRDAYRALTKSKSEIDPALEHLESMDAIRYVRKAGRPGRPSILIVHSDYFRESETAVPEPSETPPTVH